ncbi:uncharacterized protein N7473_005661 [Penicillium subrubescens]|jgi:hypothetical protein|uniref:37S ribosomal protein mrp21, mitochondrial n=1 Tax=Penicillium subrubescens TaxID=1316194 RepID=A0A1Q5T5P9_9EURO|nr:uncharacterized protein N7473_005661 [Penicillium subrubescens]KAJ5896262.1 hypothetical protein N7473_005661 [Penicillium subrubescens]OKO95542.1 hypothetical protein PENSUB_11054 [Penicillium subrubescens]
MDTRILARGLRASPTTAWLLSSRQQQQPIILNTLRYNSTTSSPQTPPSSSEPTQTNTSVSSDTPKPAPTKTVASDFDEILNKLDLGNRSTLNSKGEPRRVFSDAVSRSVGGVGSQTFKDRAAQQLASRKLELKLGPTLGRQVHVEPERGVDLPAAIRQLEITCSVNKIKANAHEQKFYKRKGAVRKELRRTRWRKLFRFSFQETVKKIQRMQAQGW